MNFNHVLKRLLSVLLVFLLVFSTFSIPITLGAKPALANSTVKLTYPKPNLESFYEQATHLVTERKNIVIHTTFRNYDNFPDDLKDFIEQDRSGSFRLNPNAQAINHLGNMTSGAIIAGAVCGVVAIALKSNPVSWAAKCAFLGGGVGEFVSKYKENAKHNYLVTINRGDIFLNVVYK